MPDTPAFDLDTIRTTYGFNPYALSPGVYACGQTEGGPHHGYLCVFTNDHTVAPALYSQPNFADATYGEAEPPEGAQKSPKAGRGLVYTFSPLSQQSSVQAPQSNAA